MLDMNRKMEYGEREINLLHLVCYLLERYKSLAAAIVIGVALSLAIGIIFPKEKKDIVDNSIFYISGHLIPHSMFCAHLEYE